MADNKQTFNVSVNGDPTQVTINVNEPLRNLVREAVKQTDNGAGHALTDWEVRSVKGGPVLDESGKIEDLQLPENVTLYIDLKVGGGG